MSKSRSAASLADCCAWKEGKNWVLGGITLSCCAAFAEGAQLRGKRDPPFTGECFAVII